MVNARSTTLCELSKLDYSASLGQVFRTATECIIRDNITLNYLSYHSFVIESLKEPEIPSWVIWMDNDPLLRFSDPFLMFDYNFIPWRAVTIWNSVMAAFGFIFDFVAIRERQPIPRQL